MEPLAFLKRRWHRLTHRPLDPVSPLGPVDFSHPDPPAAEVLSSRPTLTRLLTENIIPFWYPECLDREEGGYRLHHDAQGRWKGPADKFVIQHGRTCWFFSALVRSAWLPDALSAARAGYVFLRDRLWAGPDTGFAWSLTDRRKRLLGQVFPLYAISEYAAVSGDPEAAALARQIFDLIEGRYRDAAHGGYRCIEPTHDGSPIPKTVNEHLHVLEAYTAFASIAPDPAVRQRLLELILILTSSAVRKTSGTCTDRHRADWTPLLDRDHARISFGHDLESTWLVLDACRAIGLPAALVLDWCRTLLETTIRWGWDARAGGVHFGGPLNGPADQREKAWWVQAEALVAGLTLYRQTGDPRWAAFYQGVLTWLVRRQVDWEHGDWHALVWPSGQITGNKADEWKEPYHNGRAVLRCLDLLDPGPRM